MLSYRLLLTCRFYPSLVIFLSSIKVLILREILSVCSIKISKSSLLMYSKSIALYNCGLTSVSSLPSKSPNPHTPNLKPQTPNPKPQTSNPKPQTPNPKPQTSNPKPQTSNPKPQTPNPSLQLRPVTPIVENDQALLISDFSGVFAFLFYFFPEQKCFGGILQILFLFFRAYNNIADLSFYYALCFFYQL